MKKFLPLFILFFVSLLSSQLTYSQRQWMRTTGGSSEDKAYAIAVDKAGNTYVTGYWTRQSIDWCTIKYKPDGTEAWKVYYNGPGNSEDKAYAITLDKNGMVYVTGYSTGAGSGHDITTIKYNGSGSLKWVARYNEPGNNDDEGHSLVVDDSLNVYVTGFITRIVTDYYTIKYDSNGTYVWGNLYNGPGNGEDKAYAITLDKSGGIYVTGWSLGSDCGFDYATIKYNRTGSQVWVDRYNGPGNGEDKAYAISVDPSGDRVYVTGYSSDSVSSFDYATIKYNSGSGNRYWVKRYNGPANSEDKAYAITIDNSGYIFVTGSSKSAHKNYSEDFLTIKYNNAGDTVWTARYDDSTHNSDIAYALFVPKTGQSIYVAGSCRKGPEQNTQDIAIVKYNITNGQEIQQVKINGSGNNDDAAYAIVVDTLDNIYLTGYVSVANNGYDFVTAKYIHGDLIKVNTISSSIPKDFSLSQNYPNPFNPSTSVIFELPSSSNVRLAVYDMLGKEVTVLLNTQMKAGKYEVNFTLPELASGVYFYKLTAGDLSGIKKMVLLK